MRFPKTQVIAIVNQKGGCGKTTSSVGIAAAFAKLGYSACLVDTDPQCNATQSFGLSSEELVTQGHFTLVDAFIKKKPALDIRFDFGKRFGGNLFLVPAHTGLSAVDKRLEMDAQVAVSGGGGSDLDLEDFRLDNRYRLKNSLDSLRGHHDVVIVDTPPDLGFLMTSTLIAADWFVIPVFPSGYDLKGLELLVKTVGKTRKKYNPQLRLAGVLVGNFDRITKLDGDILKLLQERFGEEIVFRTVIPRSVRMREATVHGKTVFELPDAEGHANQFIALVQEMVNRGSKGRDQTLQPLPDEESIFQKVVNG